MLLSKGKILLKVQYTDSQVRITPVSGEFDNKELLAVFARNEELLTELYFVTHKTNRTQLQLADYFQQRGWHVEH
jgi:hypothetical protein